jgi:hypothetical protein
MLLLDESLVKCLEARRAVNPKFYTVDKGNVRFLHLHLVCCTARLHVLISQQGLEVSLIDLLN